MFRPKASVTSLVGRSTVLGEKDRKGLRSQFLAQFPKCTKEDFESVCPASSTLSVFSLKGVSCDVYVAESLPLFMTYSAKKKNAALVPTIFTLWRLPDLLPVMYTLEEAVVYMVRGADFMIPGCVNRAALIDAASQDGCVREQLQEGKHWALKTVGNPYPYAVGECCISADEFATATRGKALMITHVIGDLLYKMGQEHVAELPPGFTHTTVESLHPRSGVEDEDGKAEGEIKGEKGALAADEEETGEDTRQKALEANKKLRFPPNAVEAVIELVTLDVLKKRYSNEQCPVSASSIWGVVLAHIPKAVQDAEITVHSWLEARGVHIGSVEGKKPDAQSEVATDNQDSDAEAEAEEEAEAEKAEAEEEAEAEKAEAEKTEAEAEEAEATGSVVRDGWTVSQMTAIDLKQTSWKTAKKYAHHFKQMKIWQVKEIRGEMVVIKINFNHPLFKQYFVLPLTVVAEVGKPKQTTQKVEDAKKLSQKPLRALNVYQPLTTVKDILGKTGALDDKDKTYLTTSEISAALAKAIELSNTSAQEFPSVGQDADPTPTTRTNDWTAVVLRDPALSTLCLNKKDRLALRSGEKNTDSVTRKDLTDKFIQQGFKTISILAPMGTTVENALKNPSKDLIVIEGDAKISISVKKTKRFIRTQIAGIHYFPNIEPKSLAEKLQKQCAAAATVCEVEDVKGKNKPQGVLIQGSVAPECQKFIETNYGIPSTMIEIL
ncbi:putative translation initiation factor SUI1 [Gregarina niphandrodes]|uniref:Translation initiation factor SUI1 n=1 Tax=Gregarina niphandrodes TaxID=110365 RepID=A0A023BDS9_GRENI|nr:putative translation initiation factor SUI1 [Gregarina niphandrodes]EZG88490.1 putative translation initiation factor SUI1 [Gregarina niphandrodes]|eukprot:XP_011128551.1 putative translation initiation factor SUI1 [Gregarina niphandrodes]